VRCSAVEMFFASVDWMSRWSLSRLRIVAIWMKKETRIDALRDVINFL